MDVQLSTPLIEIKGIGPALAQRLEKLDITTVKDLLYYFPFRYQDFSQIKNIADVAEDETATIHGEIIKSSLMKTPRRKMWVFTITVADETGSIKAVWFNQKFLVNTLKEGAFVNLAGKVSWDGKKCYLSNPVHEIISQRSTGSRHTGRLVPVYSETKGVTSKSIRLALEIIMPYIQNIQEFLPETLLKNHAYPSIKTAFHMIHYPESLDDATRAYDRFAFQDLFLLQLLKQTEKNTMLRTPAHALSYTPEQIKNYFSFLPFELTLSQKKSLHDILEDLTLPHQTNRLLQGDVGSGKTIVVAIAAMVVASQGKQVVFMAPTEVLAIQHYQTFTKFFEEYDAGVALLTASHTKEFYGEKLETTPTKKEALSHIQKGSIKIIIGTHSVIQKAVTFDDVGLIIIDEQHRFGVRQRSILIDRTKENTATNRKSPHFLSMSATPIPRTLALTVCGDLDLSIISELPKNRKPISTKIVPPAQKQKTYDFIETEVKQGHQVYVVCPRIEPADPEEKLSPRQLSQLDVKSVKDEFEKLSKKIFPHLRLAMLHGQMKAKEKEEIMKDFKDKKIDILVSTSVIEVGVDVPNATIMLIEGSEHFGLSQLYQFRGRVGRGEHQSYCFLCTDSQSKTTLTRLRALITAKNGFALAEMDLRLRGPGQFLGEEQTGIPDLAMKGMQNPTMVAQSHEAVKDLLEKDPSLSHYPYLKNYLSLFSKSIHLE